MTFAVSSQALHARINRALRKLESPLMVRRCSERSRAFDTLGVYYVLDVMRNFVVETHCDLEQLAREHGVLAEWESLERNE